MGVCPNTHCLTFGFNHNFARSCFYKYNAAISSTRQTDMKHLSVTTKLWLGVGSIVLGAIVIVGHAGYNSASHQKQFNEQDRLLSQRLDQAAQWSALAQVNIVRTQAALSSSDAQEATEQRDGVAQVNEAVGSLDQMTQQNAALVEQSAAAAHSLRAQSEHLRELVQRFKVQADAPSALTRPTRVQAVLPRPPNNQRPIAHLGCTHAPTCQCRGGIAPDADQKNVSFIATSAYPASTTAIFDTKLCTLRFAHAPTPRAAPGSPWYFTGTRRI